ncbi:hypothetical protein OS493_004213 [Desmophyllum pertusum]|uniref:HEAT repeat-containing protein 6 n=1 Tax=Desmophyllum pertusum TaxID=174260 RepID=A0A9X0D703_9CNID|nr:hypothetical protein OS493_004213 [Desmophyllum pertusum]
MSFEDDKSRWTDAAHRILNLQQSSSDGNIQHKLQRLYWDELNSLDYATSIVENEEDALHVLSKCCTLVDSSGNDDFIVTKFCQLIVNLFAKQKVTVNQETLDGLVNFLVNCIKTCKKWTLLSILRALGTTLYENGSLCEQFGDSLLGKDGVLVRLCRDGSQDTDILCSTVQCVANVCMRSSNGLCMEDQFITSAFKLLLDLLQASSPKLCGTEIEHFRVSIKSLSTQFLRALPHVLVLGCSGQNQHLGPLLAALKNFMFCGMPGYKPVYTEKRHKKLEDKSGIEPDDLSSVHLNTIPQRDRTYSILSKKKKRRPNNKKSKQTTAPSTPKQITVGSSAMDALTPTFAACNLSYSVPKEPACKENQSAVIKSTDKKVLFGYWSSFVPDNTVSSSWSLFTTILKDPTPKGRAGGVAVLMDLLDGSRQFLVAAEDREQHSSSPSERPFTSFSVKLSGIVHELHRCLLQALMAETSATTKAQILKCLSLLVLNSPYSRLKEGLLSKVARQLRPLLAVKDPNLQTAVLSCLRMVVCVHTPLQEVVEIMRPTTAEISAGNRGTSQPNSSTSDSTNGNSSAEMNVDLQVPPESSWLIHWCVHAINRRENSLVVRLEALQFLGSFVKSYVFLVSSSVVECLRNLACLCLKDDDIAFTICAMKLLEEIARAMYAEFSNTQTGRKSISKDQILQFWLKLLDGPLIGMIQEGSSVSAPSCSAAVDCLSNVGAVIFNELPVHKRILCITLLLGLSNDEDKNVKASSIRALGVFVLYPCLRDDVLFVADTANAVLTAMTDAKIMVRMKAAWSLANVSDSLVTNMICEDSAFMEDFSDMLLLKLLNTSIEAADDNEKVKSNAVRALGNFLRYTRTSSLDKAGFMEAVEKAVQALVRNVGSGLMKVRWNACYAIGNVFRNPFLPIGTAAWTVEIYSGLENVICDCKNFKVRINAVIPLSVPPERRYYGDVPLYCHVYATLIDALIGTENVTEFCEFRYRDTLRQQLCNSLCHMTQLMTAEDAVSLDTVLKENHDTYKGYIRDYIRQLDTQGRLLKSNRTRRQQVKNYPLFRGLAGECMRSWSLAAAP